MKLIIGNKNYSSWSLRPWLLLKEFNVDFEEVNVSLVEPGVAQRIAQYTKASTVPVLHDDELVVWDSLAICEYISEKYLAGSAWPADVNARAEARSCSAEMHSSFFSLRNQMPMNCKIKDKKVNMSDQLLQEIARIDELWQDMRNKYKADGPYLFGKFSIADCMFAPVVTRFVTYSVNNLSTISLDYMSLILNNVRIKQWYALAEAEQESSSYYDNI